MMHALAFILVLLVLTSVNYRAFAQEESVHTIEVEGISYDIPYSVEKGKLANAQVQWDSRTVTFEFDPPANGISVQFPRDVIDDMGNINALLIKDDRGKFVSFEETVNCDSRTISVGFEEDVTEMAIIGSFLRSPDEPKKDANLELDVDGKIFKLPTFTDSRICDWRFIKEERKLEFTIQDGTHLQFLTKNELVGRPYTVLVNGKSVDFNMVNASDTSTYVSMRYNNANTIQIIGTTAIPEFPISILVAAVGMISTLVLLQLKTRKI
ncbi:MAG: hypothetical protein ACRD38_10995 [Nitrososphaerales archaeon]